MDGQILDQITHVICDTPGLQLAYLFGSQVTGKTGPLSDVDIAALFHEQSDEFIACIELAHRLTLVSGGIPVEVVSLRRAPIELAYAVIASGIRLYEINTACRVEFESRILGLYGDYLPFLRQMRREILSEVNHEQRVQRYREAFKRTERTLSEIRAAKGKNTG